MATHVTEAEQELRRIFDAYIEDYTSLTSLSTKAAPMPVTTTPVQASKGNVIEGYAAVWHDEKGEPFVDDYGDETVPGSWLATISQREKERRSTGKQYLLPYLFQHDQNKIIGGITHLAEDGRGVVYKAKLSATQLAHDVYEWAKLGILGTSYGYQAKDYAYYYNRKGKRVRQLLEVEVGEISGVTYPANPYATAEAKYHRIASAATLPGDMQLPMLPFFSEARSWCTKAQEETEVRRLREAVARREEAAHDAARRAGTLLSDMERVLELARRERA